MGNPMFCGRAAFGLGRAERGETSHRNGNCAWRSYSQMALGSELGAGMRETFLTVLIEPNVLWREGLRQILRSRLRLLKATATIDDRLLILMSKYPRVLFIVGPGIEIARILEQIAILKKRETKFVLSYCLNITIQAKCTLRFALE